MLNKYIVSLLVAFSLVFSATAAQAADFSVAPQTATVPVESGETLHHAITYRNDSSGRQVITVSAKAFERGSGKEPVFTHSGVAVTHELEQYLQFDRTQFEVQPGRSQTVKIAADTQEVPPGSYGVAVFFTESPDSPNTTFGGSQIRTSLASLMTVDVAQASLAAPASQSPPLRWYESTWVRALLVAFGLFVLLDIVYRVLAKKKNTQHWQRIIE